MRFRIGHKIALFSALIVGLAAWIVAQVMEESADYVVQREIIDLRDEALSRGTELLRDVRRFRDDVLRLSTGRLDDLEFAGPETPFDAARAEEALKRVVNSRSAARLAAFVRLGEGGRVETVLSVPDGAPVAPDTLPAELAVDLRESALPQARLSDVHEVTIDGRDRPLMWAGAPLAAANGDGEPLYVVGAVDLGATFDRIDQSARHLTFLTQDGEYLIHPDRTRGIAGQPADRRADSPDARIFELPAVGSETPPESIIAWGERHQAEKLGEAAAIEDEYERERRRQEVEQSGYYNSERMMTLAPGSEFWYRQSEELPDEVIHDATTLGRINEFFNQLYLSPPESVGPFARATRPGDLVKRVRFRAGSREAMENLSELIRRKFRDEWQVDLTWERPVACENFAVHYRRLNYDPLNADRSFGFVQAVATEEIRAEATSEMFALIKWIVIALALTAAAALFFTWRLTHPLNQITSAAKAFGATDVESESWGRQVPEIKEKLPVRRQDEIGLLAVTFDKMIDEISRSHEALFVERNLLDRRVDSRTAELKQMNEALLVARDEAESATRATERFVASVSHELRTPLNHIMGFCQLLELTDLDAQQQEDLAKISHAGKYLLGLVNDILDYQRIIMGVVDLDLEEFEVAPFVREVAETMRPKARENHSSLDVHVADDVGTLYADPKRVRQILLNLTSNACKFTREGGVTITAERARDESGEWVVLTVADTGRGMSPEQQKKLFTPFAKLSDRQGNKDGTGLGLVITKGFCERMGGEISFESEVGRGTTFTVRLPARIPDELASADQSSSAARRAAAPAVREGRAVPLPRRTGSEVVLVVDDDPHIRDMMRRFLEQRGFAIRTASSGEEGLKLAKEIRPAAITLDAVMPGMDGWETLAALKTNDQTSDIPVIMVTMLDNPNKGFSLGVSDYLMKPIDWDLLAESLRKHNGVPGDVLVVDDDPEARAALRRMLEGTGWRVHEAENGRAGLEALGRVQPRMILLDLMMPEMDGFEFVEQIQRDRSLREIPVYVLTAKDPTPEERKRLNGGVERILQKGAFRHEEILQYLHECLVEQVGRRGTHAATQGSG